MRNLVSLAAVLLALSGGAAKAALLVVVNQDDASVRIVDPITLKVTARTTERQAGGVHAHEADVSPDGLTAYLLVYGDTGVGKPGVDGQSLLLVDLNNHS